MDIQHLNLRGFQINPIIPHIEFHHFTPAAVEGGVYLPIDVAIYTSCYGIFPVLGESTVEDGSRVVVLRYELGSRVSGDGIVAKGRVPGRHEKRGWSLWMEDEGRGNVGWSWL